MVRRQPLRLASWRARLRRRGAADRAGHFKGSVAGEVVNALVDEDAARGMQVQHVAAQASLKAAGAHGALLKEGRGEAALRRARRAPTASFQRMTVALERSISRAAASRERTLARASRRTWWRMSSVSGRVPTMTLPSRLFHH
jgi:hypothetical protein